MTRRGLFRALASACSGPRRKYWPVTVAGMRTTAHTHVAVTGTVGDVTCEADGDWHVWLEDGDARVVCEVIPAIPLALPRRGQRVTARGISRRDPAHHGWAEVHPVESWEPR